jgi:hypothetical protein
MASGITSIGPLTLDELIEPTKITLTGPPDVRGGIGAKITTALISRTLVEQLESMVNNPRRRQQVAGGTGVLEWIETTAPLSHWRGWWLLSNVNLAYDKLQFIQSAASAYLPLEIDGHYLGESVVPILSSTFRSKSNDFSLTATHLTTSHYPLSRLDANAATEFTRASGTNTVGLYVASDTRRVARMDPSSLITSFTDARPCLVDSAGVQWYGPRTEGVNRIQTALMRLTLNAGGDWTVEVRTPASPSTWTSIESGLGIYQTSTLAGTVVGSKVTGDLAALTVMSTDGHYYTITVRHGDYGFRVLSTGFARWIDSAAAFSALSGNVYLESTAQSYGKRFVALVRTAAGTDLPNGKVQVGADQEVFYGYEPTSAAANDTSANQGKQFLSDRNSILTVE